MVRRVLFFYGGLTCGCLVWSGLVLISLEHSELYVGTGWDWTGNP